MASHPLIPVRRRQASRCRKARRANPMWAIRARAERIWAFSTPVPGSAGRTRCVAPTMRCCAIPVSSASCKQFLCLRAGTSRARSCSAPISLSIRSGYDAPAKPDSQGVPGPECPATFGPDPLSGAVPNSPALSFPCRAHCAHRDQTGAATPPARSSGPICSAPCHPPGFLGTPAGAI